MSTPVKVSFIIALAFTLFLVFLFSLHHYSVLAFLGLEALVLIAFVICPLLFRRYEKKQYNHGICTKCGEKMEYFDTDSGGNDGYMCRKCHRSIWIGWYDPKEEK